MSDMVWVFLSGPYTADPVDGTRNAIFAAEAVLNAGAFPVVPHLTLLFDLVSRHDAGFYYAYDLNFLARCDALLRLPGASAGADKEVAAALHQNKPVALLADFGGDVAEATRRLVGHVQAQQRERIVAQ